VPEQAKTSNRVSKEEFKAAEPGLRMELVNAQYDLQSADFPVVVLIMGDDRLGANRLLDRLHEWMDVRYIDTHVFPPATDEERLRPRFWRYWRELPPKGRIGIYFGAWALGTIADRINKDLSKRQFERRIEHIRRFEQDQIDDGALVLKYWIHLPPKEFARRMKKADRLTTAQVDDLDWEIYHHLNKAEPVSRRYLEATNTAKTPWTVVESTDPRYCQLTVARSLLASMQTRLAGKTPSIPTPKPGVFTGDDALSKVNLDAKLERNEYKRKLEKRQVQLNKLVGQAHQAGISTVLAFEGWDAAGKGGVIRRITGALAAAYYSVAPVAAPTDEEKARHYLWRFWRRIPMPGKFVIFDRSWYGRVLVERVEGFAKPAEWQRAYDEINDFEQQLAEHGMLVLKFWMHIDPDEQLRRFKAREQTGYKKYKITDEDYRNRDKWDDYVAAVNEMVARTDTDAAPWHLIPANDKPYARVKVLDILCKALKKRLKS